MTPKLAKAKAAITNPFEDQKSGLPAIEPKLLRDLEDESGRFLAFTIANLPFNLSVFDRFCARIIS